jgi:hypothetical protein
MSGAVAGLTVSSHKRTIVELSFVALETEKMNGKEATALSSKLFFSWVVVE